METQETTNAAPCVGSRSIPRRSSGATRQSSTPKRVASSSETTGVASSVEPDGPVTAAWDASREAESAEARSTTSHCQRIAPVTVVIGPLWRG